MSSKRSLSRHWLRFSLRSLIVVVLLSSVAFAVLYYEFRSAESRRMAVERLRDFPGYVQYENEPRTTKARQAKAAKVNPAEAWLRERLGVDFFQDVDFVCLDGRGEFSDADFAATCRLHKLTSLRLGRTAVTDEGIQPISNLSELQMVSISSPHLTDHAMTCVAKLPELKRLSLYEVAITDAGLEKLVVLVNLEWLSLRKTKVTKEGVAALQSALPDCKITLKR